MDQTVKWSRCALRALLWLATIAFSLAPAYAAQAAPAQTPAPAPAPAAAGDYVGSDTCSDCHFAEFQQFQKTAMSAILSNKYPVEQRGCEACHGPGRAHATAEKAEQKGAAALIWNPARHSPKEVVARCMVCHQKDEGKRLFTRARHAAALVSCIECHDPHLLTEAGPAKPTGALETYFSVPQRSQERDWLDNRLTRQKQPELCFSCHKDIEAQFQLPIRHRVNEGLVKCTDCHNPHGSLTPRELRDVGTTVCYKCHVEKKGPFVYEHAPVIVEGCTVCHTPHGSINLHLLKRREERQLCLECHVAPQAINVPHPKPSFRTDPECTRCHVQVHGSNYQPQFLR